MSTNREQSAAAGAPRCPVGWRTSAQNSQECFPVCPAGYTFKNPGTGVQSNGNVDLNPSCVLDTDPRVYVPAQNVNIASTPAEFDVARQNFDAAVQAKNAEIGRNKLIDNAKQALLNRDVVRNEFPDAYQQARVNYYTLVQGDSWLQDEERRVSDDVVRRDIQNYYDRIRGLWNRLSSHDQYSDMVRNTSENVLQAKDDFKYIVNKFSEQMDKINSETKKQQREAQDRDLSFLSTIDTVLNWLIIVFLLVVIGLVGYRVYLRYQYYYGKTNAIELNV